MKTESIRLSDERRAALERVAARCGVVNQRGTEAGKPSWRALVYAIADGAVKCTPTKKSESPPREKPSACSLLGDVIEAPGPYDVVPAHNSELWLVVDAHRDAILWTEQKLAADAAAEALNGMARQKQIMNTPTRSEALPHTTHAS